MSKGSWQVTARVWQICDFPVRNSPKISVMEPVSMPPARRVSSCLEPVVMDINSARRSCMSVAVVKPIGTILFAVESLAQRHKKMIIHPNLQQGILKPFAPISPSLAPTLS